MENGKRKIVKFFQLQKLIGIFCILHFAFCIASAQGLPVAAPQTVGMSAEKLNQIDALVKQGIADKKTPGAVVLVGRKGKIVYRKAFGNRSLVPTVEKMTVDTIFDAASLTKVVATATSVMILVERGKIRLTDTIGKFIPEIEDENAKRVTIQQLLTHVSGYRPDFDLGEKWTGRDGMLQALHKEKLRNPPGTRFVYSDIGFIVLGEIVERINGVNVSSYHNGLGFKGIELKSTFFSRLSPDGTLIDFTSFANEITPYNLTKRIAPTENIKGQNNYLGAKFEGDE